MSFPVNSLYRAHRAPWSLFLACYEAFCHKIPEIFFTCKQVIAPFGRGFCARDKGIFACQPYCTNPAASRLTALSSLRYQQLQRNRNLGRRHSARPGFMAQSGGSFVPQGPAPQPSFEDLNEALINDRTLPRVGLFVAPSWSPPAITRCIFGPFTRCSDVLPPNAWKRKASPTITSPIRSPSQRGRLPRLWPMSNSWTSCIPV